MREESRLESEVLESLESPPELYPHLDALLADLPSLGTDPDEVVALLRPLGLPATTRALDLGCGSGIVSVALARAFGFAVAGIDGYAPFVERARARAAAAGVAALCSFRTGDLRVALVPDGADLVVFGAVGAVLGDLGETVRRLAAAVRPGGHVVLDHAYAAHDGDATPEYPALTRARAVLDAAAEILGQRTPTVEESRQTNARNNRLLAARAAQIAGLVPALAAVLEAYLDRKRVECERLESSLFPVLWLLRRRA